MHNHYIKCELIGDSHMPGTITGGQKAADTNMKKYGKDFYARIGAIGGKKGTTGGFAANRELARLAGAKGGRISRRRKTDVAQTEITKVQATIPEAKTQNDFELAA
jgi:general stress protein YciG